MLALHARSASRPNCHECPISDMNNPRSRPPAFPCTAAKIMLKSSLSDEDKAALAVEVRAMQMLNGHPNFVQLYDFFDEDTHFYLVMELITGGELFDRICEKERYTEREARACIMQLAAAIQYAHSRGVVHRDLKPENILLKSRNDDTSIKLADLGFAKVLSNPNDSMTTPCGTPGYVAPEVIAGRPYSAACDIWSLGVIFYILLCGYVFAPILSFVAPESCGWLTLLVSWSVYSVLCCHLHSGALQHNRTIVKSCWRRYPPFASEDGDQKVLFEQIRTGAYRFDPPEWDAVSSEAKDLVSHILVVSPDHRFTAQQVRRTASRVVGACSLCTERNLPLPMTRPDRLGCALRIRLPRSLFECDPQIMNHRWMTQNVEAVPDIALEGTMVQLKRFNARRKFKGAVNTVRTTVRMKLLMAARSPTGGAGAPEVANGSSASASDGGGAMTTNVLRTAAAAAAATNGKSAAEGRGPAAVA